MGKRKPRMSLKRGETRYYRGYNRWVQCSVYHVYTGGTHVAVFITDDDGVVPGTVESLRTMATRSLWSYVPEGREKAES